MNRHFLTGVFLLACCAAAHGGAPSGKPVAQEPAALQQLRAACQPGDTPGASLGHVQVRAVAAQPGDLPYFEARSSATGSSVRIYHDPELAGAAASKAACYMGMLDLLPAAIPDRRNGITWSPIVITRKADYVPPKRDGEVRWAHHFSADSWDPKALRFLLLTMAHEQVHLSQGKIGLPRWFQEGHAEWASLQVTEQIRPDLAYQDRTQRAEDARKLGAAHLGAWGGIRVKSEAIERQLSAEDRARRAKDPAYQPTGPFSFNAGDYEQDMGNEEGRYGAALALFQGLEQRHGRAAVQAWVSAVLDGKAGGKSVALARQLLGEDITPLLR